MVPNCSPGHNASIGTKFDLPRSNFEVYLSRSLSKYHAICYDLWWPQYLPDIKKFHTKVFQKVFQQTIQRGLPFAATIRGVWDLSPGGRRKAPLPAISSLSEPARNRVKYALRNQAPSSHLLSHAFMSTLIWEKNFWNQWLSMWRSLKKIRHKKIA